MSTIKANAVTGSTTNNDLALTGNGSGVVKIGDGAIKFPDADGSANQIMSTNGSAQLSFVTPSGGFTLATEQSTSSGTSVTFSSIPAGVTMIIINFSGVGFTALVDCDITIGDAGGLETSSYISRSYEIEGSSTHSQTGSTAEFIIGTTSAARSLHGSMVLTLEDSVNFTWCCSVSIGTNTDGVMWGGGTKSLSAELTQVSISGGTFDAGAINIMYQ
jgi:hypothetical protein